MSDIKNKNYDEMNNDESKEKLITLKFEGQNHQVDIKTYTQVLIEYTNIVTETAEVLELNQPVNVYINANNEGSLEALISIASVATGALPLVFENTETIVGIINIIKTITGVLNLKKDLIGKKEIKEVKNEINVQGNNNIILVTDSGNLTTDEKTFKAFSNPKIANSINSTFEALEDDPAVEGLQILDKNDSLFSMKREGFSPIVSTPNFENETTKHLNENADLNLMKPFLGDSKTRKWEFNYRGNRIAATIQDDNFLENISKYPFYVGTTMNVELDITQVYNKNYKCWENKKYSVIKVNDLIKPPEQMSLFDDNNA